MYDEKKTEYPENVSGSQETLQDSAKQYITIKGKSSIPLAGGIGLVFSGCVLESKAVVIALVVAVVVVEFLYYGPGLCKIFLDYKEKRNQQKDEHNRKMKELEYNQSISKKDANQYGLDQEKMRLDHEYRMKLLDKGIIDSSISTVSPDSSAGGIIPPTDNKIEETRYLN